MFLDPKHQLIANRLYTSGPFLILFQKGDELRGLVRHVNACQLPSQNGDKGFTGSLVKASLNYTRDTHRNNSARYRIWIKGLIYGGQKGKPLDAEDPRFTSSGTNLWDFLYPLPSSLTKSVLNPKVTENVEALVRRWATTNLEELRFLGENRKSEEDQPELKQETQPESIHGDVILHKGKVYYINEMCTPTPTLELLDDYLDVLPPKTHQWILSLIRKTLKSQDQ